MAKTFFYRKPRLSRETPVSARFIPESGSPSELRVSRFESGLEYSVPSNLLEKVPAKVELTIDGKVASTHTLKGETPVVTPGGGGNVSPPVSNGVLTFGKGVPTDNPDVDAYLDIESGQLYRWFDVIQGLGTGASGYTIDDNRYGASDAGTSTLIPNGEEATYGVIRSTYSNYAWIHGLEPTSEFGALVIEPVETIAPGGMELMGYIYNADGDREDQPLPDDVAPNFGMALILDIEGMGVMTVPADGDMPAGIELPTFKSSVKPGIYSFGVVQPEFLDNVKNMFEQSEGVTINSVKVAPMINKSSDGATFVARWAWAEPGSYETYRDRVITHHLASGPAT